MCLGQRPPLRPMGPGPQFVTLFLSWAGLRMFLEVFNIYVCTMKIPLNRSQMTDRISDSLYSVFHDVTVLANLASFCVKFCKQILKVFFSIWIL